MVGGVIEEVGLISHAAVAAGTGKGGGGKARRKWVFAAGQREARNLTSGRKKPASVSFGENDTIE
jgi:hypothetical protein